MNKIFKSEFKSLLTTKKCSIRHGNWVKNNKCHKFLKFPMPRSMAEFDVLSEIVWGTKIGIRYINVIKYSCKYSIEKAYDSYAPKLSSKEMKNLGLSSYYDLNDIFCKTIFGILSCGGVAKSAYGQSHILSHRQRICLEKLVQDMHERLDQRRPLRPSFVRLAQYYGLGEIKAKTG